jgi:hypothetical protein
MKEKNKKKQLGFGLVGLAGFFVIVLLFLVGGAVAASINVAGYTPINPGGATGGFIAGPTGDESVENVEGDGAHVNGDPSRPFIPCLKQNSSMWCGRASAQMIIRGYTGELIPQGRMQTSEGTNWSEWVNNKVPGNWTRKSYKSDNMQGVIDTIRGGNAVIIFTKNPVTGGTHGHIMPVLQYDESKDSFLLNSSGTSGCQMHWVGRSFFLENAHSDVKYKYIGP